MKIRCCPTIHFLVTMFNSVASNVIMQHGTINYKYIVKSYTLKNIKKEELHDKDRSSERAECQKQPIRAGNQ